MEPCRMPTPLWFPFCCITFALAGESFPALIVVVIVGKNEEAKQMLIHPPPLVTVVLQAVLIKAIFLGEGLIENIRNNILIQNGPNT